MIRPVVLVLTIATGFTGLVYEVTWQRFHAPLRCPQRGAARRAVDLYERYYHFAAPFDRSSLARAFRHCEAPPGLRRACRQARVLAEKRVGSIDLRIVSEGVAVH